MEKKEEKKKERHCRHLWTCPRVSKVRGKGRQTGNTFLRALRENNRSELYPLVYVKSHVHLRRRAKDVHLSGEDTEKTSMPCLKNDFFAWGKESSVICGEIYDARDKREERVSFQFARLRVLLRSTLLRHPVCTNLKVCGFGATADTEICGFGYTVTEDPWDRRRAYREPSRQGNRRD